MVGINYNKRTKKHQCKIERIAKVSQATGESVPSSGEKVSQASDESVLSITGIDSSFSVRKKETATRVIEQLLQNKEMTILDLMAKVGGTNRSRFRSGIIEPLIDSGMICPVYKETPRHPNQKYRLTETIYRKLTKVSKDKNNHISHS